jgi:hypothetical protein
MRRLLLAFGLLGSLAGTADVAVAQDCVQDQYGRIICGQRVRPQYAPEPRYYQQPQQPYYQQREYYRGGGDGYQQRGGYQNDEGFASPSRRNRTWNGCPNGYTIQDGVCKPYTGR